MTRVTCLALLVASVAFISVESVPCDEDPCKSAPCKNGGACDPTATEWNRFTCKCPASFQGTYCEVEAVCGNIDPCNPSPCRNKGACTSTGVDGQGYERYKCTCADGFRGIDCAVAPIPAEVVTTPPTTTVPTTTTTTPPPVTLPPDPCKPSPCKNNEKCNPTPGGGKPYTCSCPTEFSGCACEWVKPIACPTGFRFLSESKSCIRIITTKASWDDQAAKCTSLHPQAVLVAINSKAEDDLIVKQLQTSITKDELATCTPSGFYIGLQLVDRNNCKSGLVWKPCNRPLVYNDWNQGEPNCSNPGNPEGCVTIWPEKAYHWNDIHGATATCAICEITLAGST